MSPLIESIYGLEPGSAEILRAAGCETTRDLLRTSSRALDRRVLSVSTGQAEEQILGWAQIAELFEIPDMDEFGVALLCEAGFGSVGALAEANESDLEERFQKLHCLGGLFEALPDVSSIRVWIQGARKLSSQLEI